MASACLAGRVGKLLPKAGLADDLALDETLVYASAAVASEAMSVISVSLPDGSERVLAQGSSGADLGA